MIKYKADHEWTIKENKCMCYELRIIINTVLWLK